MLGFRVLILSMVMGLGLCFCQVSLSSAAKAPKPKPPLYEPVSTKRAQAKFKEKFSQADGFVFSEYWLTMPLVRLSLPSEQKWVIVDEEDPTVNFRLRQKWREDVVADFKVYAPGEWFPDLSDESIERYVESLRRKYKDRVTFDNEKENFKIKPGLPPLPGSVREVFYTVENPKEESLTQYRELIIELRESKAVLMIRIYGPNRLVDQFLPDLRIMLAGMREVRDNER